MKTYSNIGELYREKFSDYAPTPPAEVWERIQKTRSRGKLSVKGKAAIVATAAAVLITATYFGLNSVDVENQPIEQIIAQNNPSETVEVVETGIIAAGSSVETPKKAAEVALLSGAIEIPLEPTISTYNNLPSEPSNNVVPVPPSPQKEEKEIKVEREIKEEKAKTLPIIFSKDTTVCEGSTVKLFVLNAKNVRWSTGGTQNAIFAIPSYDEQYSVTFTTADNYDTTVTISIKCKPCLLIPNAFTPNGDGLNDVFTAQSNEEYSYFEMTIYSSSGQPLFVSKSIKHGWDGTYKGTLQPQGTYLYIIRYVDSTGKMDEKRGTVALKML